jgi:putative endopeptidase
LICFETLKDLGFFTINMEFDETIVDIPTAISALNKIKNVTDIPYENPYRVKPKEVKDNFYQYVNREYLANVSLTDNQPMESRFSELGRLVDEQVRDIIDDVVKHQNDYGKETGEYKLAESYRLYMDIDKRNVQGIGPITPYIQAVIDAKDKDALLDVLIANNIDSYYFAKLGIAENINTMDEYALYIGEPRLGLIKKKYYKEEKDTDKKVMGEYLKLLQSIFVALGLDNEQMRADKVVKFEKKLANVMHSPKESQEIKKVNNTMDLKKIESLSDDLKLVQYIKSYGYDNAKTFIVTNPKALKSLNKIFAKEELDTLKDYSVAIMFLSNYKLLSEDFYGLTKELNNAILGSDRLMSLEDRAIEYSKYIFPDVASKLYVDKYFSNTDKQDVMDMAQDIISAFEQRLQNNTWLSESAKSYALEKLSSINIKVGYPDRWDDYSDIDIDSDVDSIFTQNIKLRDRAIQKNLELLKSSVDKDNWQMLPIDVNAYYSHTDNEIVFPAALLQPPFYSNGFGKEKNMGGIGVIIAHEITHAFDDTGALFSKDGELYDWWEKSDKVKFKVLGDKLAKQYSAYELLPDVYINGELTLGETISDLGGLTCALDIISRFDNPNYRDFFESFANIWAMKLRNEVIVYLNEFDTHPISIARVNQTLKNLDKFIEIYSIKEGDNMYLKKEDRVSIW